MEKNRTGGDAIKGGYPPSTVRGHARRTFSSDYKLSVLRIAREWKETRKELFRAFMIREGLETSHLRRWEKQASQGLLGKARRGRPGKSRHALCREIVLLKQSLAAAEKHARQAEEIVRLQMKYVRGAAWKLERKDRGLLAGLLARVDRECSVSSLCEALDLTRRDFYRTIKPLLDGVAFDSTVPARPSLSLQS